MWVFGYGSLAALPGAERVTLDGYRRVWGVAMDNTVELPGYKVYEREDGTRPDVCVAFVDLTPDPGATVSGARIPVDDAALAELDARERSYHRVQVNSEPGGWVYRGRGEARARAKRARLEGRLVVQREYYELVRAALGEVEDPGCPIVDLVLKPTPP
jgi:hypothetical protein